MSFRMFLSDKNNPKCDRAIRFQLSFQDFNRVFEIEKASYCEFDIWTRELLELH